MAVTMASLLKGRCAFEDLDKSTQSNVTHLLEVLIELDGLVYADTGRHLDINDGVRIRGLNDYGAKDSTHYKGLAADLDDDDTAWLWKWFLKNLDTIARLGLYLEDPRWTHGKVGTWMHVQTVPPKSGRRIYIPSSKPMSAPTLWDGVYDQRLNRAA